MLNIGVLVSGGGTNLQAILDAVDSGIIQNGRVVTVVASKAGVYALQRAENHGVEGVVLAKRDFSSQDELDAAIVAHMKSRNVDLIVMAGYLSIVGDRLIDAYENKIINIHPSLIPSFCGKGYYGLHVHEKVLEYGVKLTGATVHFVNNVPDGGAIIAQKAVAVEEGDTPEVLQKRVMEQAEWHILPQAIAWFCDGRLTVDGRNVRLLP
ncbi:MAG: phosphoribosylglycinamide formyltransferase [Ruminococcaceae bacterium]|nr:phosphoribosylglycinamide formyltransferase [Oscillospiraceae bacterium]